MDWSSNNTNPMEGMDMSKEKFSLSFIRKLLRRTPKEAEHETPPVVLPYFLRPGMGGTTIAHPSAGDVLCAMFDGEGVRVHLNDKENGIVGTWTIDPEVCDFDLDGAKSFTFTTDHGPVTVRVEGMTECEAGAYAHTIFLIPGDGSGISLTDQGYRCFHSSKRIDNNGKEFRRRIILVFPPSGGLPKVPPQ